jgi:hypothetical protein
MEVKRTLIHIFFGGRECLEKKQDLFSTGRREISTRRREVLTGRREVFCMLF